MNTSPNNIYNINTIEMRLSNRIHDIQERLRLLNEFFLERHFDIYLILNLINLIL